jgi:2-polyprenyl-6-methoxyphenol hydroxylase-like FAD-dependent oxidoreductase
MADSSNLGPKLAAVIAGTAPAGLLDTYQAERGRAAGRNMLHTQAQVALRRGYDPAAQALRELFGELLADEQAQSRIGAFIAGTG